jgi:peptidyl-prolyl cis-trans isomerase SurA
MSGLKRFTQYDIRNTHDAIRYTSNRWLLTQLFCTMLTTKAFKEQRLMPKLALLLVLTSLIAAGCNTPEELQINQQKRLKNAKASRFRTSGSPSIAISGQIITCDELLNSPILDNKKLVPLSEVLKPKAKSNDLENFKINAEMPFKQALANKISYTLIYEMAKKQAQKESKKEVSDQFDEAIEQQLEKYIKDFVINQYGGDYAKAQEYLESQGSDWESFRESQRRLILINSQLPQIRPITYPELLETYELMKENFYTELPLIQIRLIDIDLDRYRPPEPNRDKLEQARQLAQDLTAQLRADANFAQLAKQYSHGHMKIYAGLWKPTNPESFAKPYDILAAEAEKMKPGQISGPIETDPPNHIFIMKLVAKKNTKTIPLREVQRHVEEQLVYERRQQATFDLDVKIENRAELAQTDEFIDLCLDRIYKINTQ